MPDILLLTIAEAAAMLRVSVDTIRRQIRLGIIPVKRIRTNIRISRAWIDSYVAETAPMLLSRRQVAVKLGVSNYVVDGLRRRRLLLTVTIAGRNMVPVSAVNEYVRRSAFAFLRPARKTPDVPRPASSANFAEHPASGSNLDPQRSSAARTVFSNVRGV